MAEMLCLSARVHEAIVRQIFPNITDEVVDIIMGGVTDISYPCYGRLNPLYYANWWEFMRENFEDIPAETIDQMYVNVVEKVLNSTNPLREVVIHDLSRYEFGDYVHQIAYECERIIYYHRLIIAKISGRDPMTVVSPQQRTPEQRNSAEDSGPDLPNDW